MSVMTKSADDVMTGLLLVFALLASGRAFLLVSPVDILQTPLPSFSIFLLATITSLTHVSLFERMPSLDRTPFSLFCFLLLCMSTLYIFCQEQGQRWFAIHPPLRFQRRLILWTALFSLLSYPAIIVIGWLLQPFNLYAMTRAHNQHPLNWHLPFLSPHQYAFELNDDIDMMSSDVPQGKNEMMRVTVQGKFQRLLWLPAPMLITTISPKSGRPMRCRRNLPPSTIPRRKSRHAHTGPRQ